MGASSGERPAPVVLNYEPAGLFGTTLILPPFSRVANHTSSGAAFRVR
jgi:hypothetical protein